MGIINKGLITLIQLTINERTAMLGAFFALGTVGVVLMNPGAVALVASVFVIDSLVNTKTSSKK